jgi:hypothetical protein
MKSLPAKKAYTRTYNKLEKVGEKVKAKYLSSKKTNPVGEIPLRIPDISVSSILCFILLCNKSLSWFFLHYYSLWFPIFADCKPLSLLSPPDELKETFTADQRVTLLKCLQRQDDQEIPGYVLCKDDWVAKRTLILEYFDPDRPAMIKWMKSLGYELRYIFYWDEYLNGKKTPIHKSAYSFFHSRLLYTFSDYDSGKSPAPSSHDSPSRLSVEEVFSQL